MQQNPSATPVTTTAHQSLWAGETIWITGASSGIGEALALRLSAEGANVIASGRNQQALSQLASSNENIIPLTFDVTDESSIPSARQQLEDLCQNSLDRVIINAGTCEYFDLNQPDWSMMERIMRTNYLGAVNTLAVALPLLKQAHHGHIIGIASQAAFAPFPRAEAYGASKAALQYFLNALRIDLTSNNIDVSVIDPGFIKTPLTDRNDFAMPFLLDADTAARRICYAIEQRKRHYAFPRRLHCLLRILNACPKLWHWLMTRSQSKQA